MKIIALLVFLNGFIVSCKKGENCPTTFYLPAQLSPVKIDYKVGDTIVVKSSFYREVTGYSVEGKQLGSFNMEGILWNPATGIYRIDRDSVEMKSVILEAFDFVENINYDYNVNLFTSGSILTGEFNYQADTFDLSYSLVALEPGLYYHEFGSLAGISDNQKFAGKCPGGFSVYFELNKGTDGNISLLSESLLWHYNTWIVTKPKDRFYDMGGFAFRVVP